MTSDTDHTCNSTQHAEKEQSSSSLQYVNEQLVPGFSWIIQDELAGMKFPNESQFYENLLSEPFGVGLVICVNEKLPAFIGNSNSNINISIKKMHVISSVNDLNSNLNVAHFPIDDYGTPNNFEMVEKIIELVRTVKSNTIQNMESKGIVVHCMAGLSRTGMVLACILVSVWKMTVSDAIQLVNQKRGKNGRAVMTFKQEKFVQDFYNYCNNKI
ncbi:hypothetical protein C9374_001784 [Naegleria lovaniensis]|uniref:Tyrosine specific protein phosphatases domain-containing protein n=1 Tax=Naegleria lovaniensis TaxID=51637 RepID=A0AA88GUW9_NAELO|nr:uncharacterized protein C9374_001784 [Naegleria lovaniensis]KAG2387452.1 hypothetical protein C9374_001784 [Naegleria lovaniensis]